MSLCDKQFGIAYAQAFSIKNFLRLLRHLLCLPIGICYKISFIHTKKDKENYKKKNLE